MDDDGDGDDDDDDGDGDGGDGDNGGLLPNTGGERLAWLIIGGLLVLVGGGVVVASRGAKPDLTNWPHMRESFPRPRGAGTVSHDCVIHLEAR